jgi:hypothetical protein
MNNHSRTKTQGLAALLTALSLATTVSAAEHGPKESIERFERCKTEEKQCVKILKKKKANDSKLEIKAQIRGANIIWYSYNQKNGKVKRLN